MKYLVSHQGQECGPFTVEEIVAKVRAKQLEIFDYLYDSGQSDWVLLLEHEAVAQKLKSDKPQRPPELKSQAAAEPIRETEPTPHQVNEWYVLKGDNRYGPFGYDQMVKMLQDKILFTFDFIWRVGLPEWKRIAELPDFQSETIRRLIQQKEMPEVFKARKFKRHPFAGRVIVHDNLKVWQGRGLEISQGGAGVVMANALVVPGQQLTVHFSGHEGWPAFNAICEVVSKKFVDLKTKEKSPVEYGLKFLSLSQEAQDELNKKVI